MQAEYRAQAVFDVLESRERSQAWLARRITAMTGRRCSESLISKMKYGERSIPPWFITATSAVLDLPPTVLFSAQELAQASDTLAPGGNSMRIGNDTPMNSTPRNADNPDRNGGRHVA